MSGTTEGVDSMRRRKFWKKEGKPEHSILIQCESCGQQFMPGSSEDVMGKRCFTCRKKVEPNPDIDPPRYDVVTEGWDPDKIKR
jgi:hypothetical protein